MTRTFSPITYCSTAKLKRMRITFHTLFKIMALFSLHITARRARKLLSMRGSGMVHCDPRFKYHSFIHLVASSTGFGTSLVACSEDVFCPRVSIHKGFPIACSLF